MKLNLPILGLGKPKELDVAIVDMKDALPKTVLGLPTVMGSPIERGAYIPTNTLVPLKNENKAGVTAPETPAVLPGQQLADAIWQLATASQPIQITTALKAFVEFENSLLAAGAVLRSTKAPRQGTAETHLRIAPNDRKRLIDLVGAIDVACLRINAENIQVSNLKDAQEITNLLLVKVRAEWGQAPAERVPVQIERITPATSSLGGQLSREEIAHRQFLERQLTPTERPFVEAAREYVELENKMSGLVFNPANTSGAVYRALGDDTYMSKRDLSEQELLKFAAAARKIDIISAAAFNDDSIQLTHDLQRNLFEQLVRGLHKSDVGFWFDGIKARTQKAVETARQIWGKNHEPQRPAVRTTPAAHVTTAPAPSGPK